MDDNLIKRLGRDPVPSGLVQIDEAVLSAISEMQNDRKLTYRTLTLAALAALGVGYVGDGMLPTPVAASDQHLVFAETELAPSTLLDFL